MLNPSQITGYLLSAVTFFLFLLPLGKIYDNLQLIITVKIAGDTFERSSTGFITARIDSNASKKIATLLSLNESLPESPIIVRTLANVQWADGNTAEAIQTLQQFLSLYEDNFSRWDLALMYEQRESLGLQSKASPELLSMWSLANVSEEKFQNLGKYAYGKQQFSNAIRWYLRATKVNPESSAWLELGKSYEASNKFDDARYCYIRAVDIEPDNRDIWYLLGMLELKAGKPTEAQNALMKGKDATLGTLGKSDMLYWYGYVNQREINPPQNDVAFNSFIEALQVDEYFSRDNLKARTYFLLGRLYFDGSDFDKALISFKQAINVDESYLSPYVAISSTLQKLSRYDEAELYLKAAMEIAPDNISVLYSLGTLYALQNKSAQAKEVLQKALTIDRDNEAVRQLLSSLR